MQCLLCLDIVTKKGSSTITEDALGTITVSLHLVQLSKVLISSGWENGVISGNQVQLDEPIYFAGSAPITSWYGAYGSLKLMLLRLWNIHQTLIWLRLLWDYLGKPILQICI